MDVSLADFQKTEFIDPEFTLQKYVDSAQTHQNHIVQIFLPKRGNKLQSHPVKHLHGQ